MSHSCNWRRKPKLIIVTELRVDPSKPKMRYGHYMQLAGLMKHSFDVTFTFTKGFDPWANQPLPSGASPVILPTISSKRHFLTLLPKSARILRRAMRQHDIGLVIAPLFPTIPALIAARLARRPSVLLIQAPMSAWGNLFYRRPLISKIASLVLLNLEVLLSTETLVLSRHLIRDVVRPLRRKVSVTPFSALSDEDFVPSEEAAAYRDLNLLVVGRLIALKRVDVAIETVALLRNRGMAASLTVVGEGEKRRELERLTNELGISDSVEFAGWIADPVELRNHYRRAFALLLPSEFEGLGLVALESMAAGTPVVRTAASELAELFRPGHDILVVPTQSPEMFADVVTRLYKDRDLYVRIAHAGQERALFFTAEAWHATFCEHAQRLIG